MPKTKLQDAVFTALMATLMVYGMIVYNISLDLGGVSFMDSSGIAVVLRTWRRMSQLGGVMTVRNVPPQAAKVLKAAGIDKLIPFQE